MDRASPWKKAAQAASPPRSTAVAIPVHRAFFARSGCPAPRFCAVKAEMDCIYATGISRMNSTSFSAMPTPAEAVTPRAFTRPMRMR